MNSETQLHIQELIEAQVSAAFVDVFIVDILFRNEGGSEIVEVLVDTDSGIRLDQCADISKAISGDLEERDLIETAYNVMVSSPGLDRPLTHPRQLTRAVGKMLSVSYTVDNQPRTEDLVLRSYEPESETLEFLNSKDAHLYLNRSDIHHLKYRLQW